jgi:hypothetical protein
MHFQECEISSEYGACTMKIRLIPAMLALGFALSPAAFAQDLTGTHTRTPPTAWQTTPAQKSDVIDSGYGTESAGTSNGSNASRAQETRRGALTPDQGRNDLFAHH